MDKSSKNSKKSFKWTKFSDLDLSLKIKVIFLSIAVLCILIIGISFYLINRNSVQDSAFDRLSALRNEKKADVEQYFTELQNQALTMSQSPAVINGFMELQEGFRELKISDLEMNQPLNTMRIDVQNYYQAEYLSELNKILINDLSIESVWQDDPVTTYLQYHYLADNVNKSESKDLLDRASDGSKYSEAHYEIHSFFRRYKQRFDIRDIYLLDAETGDVIYSVAKKADFATNIVYGPYSNSVLNDAFRAAADANSNEFVEITDMHFYDPEKATPVMFIASPVYVGLEKKAVLVFEIDSEQIRSVVYGNNSYTDIGLGNTGDLFIFGGDFYNRISSRLFHEESKELKKLLRKTENEFIMADEYGALKSSALREYQGEEFVFDALQGEKGTITARDTWGKQAFNAYAPLDVKGLSWAISAQQYKSEILEDLRKQVFIVIGIAVILLLLVFLIINYFTKSLSERIVLLTRNITSLSRGEISDQLKVTAHDVLSQAALALNNLNQRIDHASDFALKVGKGDFSVDFEPISENDKLGNSLQQMRRSLEDAKKEEELRSIEDNKRNWTTQGIARFSELFRKNNDLSKLSYSIVSNLVDYMKIDLAGLFVLNDENDEAYLELLAAYAYDREKYLTKKVMLGEGMVGTVAVEKQTLYLKELPEDYITISSGFGESKPNTVLIVPMIADDQVMGVIEMASLRSLEQHEIEFVEKLAEDIGSTLISTRVNERTNKLLEESKVRSEEMAAQEEELRQNLEELQATQDEMKRIKTEEEKKEEDRRRAEEEMMLKLKEQNRKLKEDESVLKAQQDELEKEKVLMDTLMENVPDYIYFKDKDCKFVRISRSMVRLFPGADNPEDLIGKSDFDFHKPEAAQQFYDDEKSIMNTGEAIIDDIVHEEFDDGQDQWVSTTKMPLKNKEGKTIGIWGLTKNITNIKNLEIEARQQAEASKVHEEEVNKYRQMLSDILENIPGKVFVKDEEGNILLSNSAVANLYDCTVEELIGKSDYDFYPKETADKFRAEELNIMREGKQSWLQEEEQKGVTARLYTTKMPFYIKTREETGLLGIQIDITDIVNQGEGISDELLKEKGEEVQKYIDRIEEARKEIEKLKKR